jgi:hypothetical protein
MTMKTSRMAKTSGNEKIDRTVPKEVRTLIARKVALRWREQRERYATATLLAYSKLQEEIVTVIGTGKIPLALTSIPLAAYEEISADAVDIMKS